MRKVVHLLLAPLLAAWLALAVALALPAGVAAAESEDVAQDELAAASEGDVTEADVLEDEGELETELIAQASWGIRCDQVAITSSMQVADSITVNNCTVPAYYAPRGSSDPDYDGSGVYSCAAFVSRFYRMVFGINVSNLYPGNWPVADSGSFVKTDTPKIGDIAAFSGHWAIVRSVSGNEVTLVEQNAFWSYAPNSQAMVHRVIEKGQAIAYYHHPANNLVDPNADQQPIGSIDVCEGGAGTVHVRGWAYDPDVPSQSIDVHLYVNDVCIRAFRADQVRTDVNERFGISGNHGFEFTHVAVPGNSKVVVFAINNNDAGNPPIGNGVTSEFKVSVTAPTYRNGTVANVPTNGKFLLIPLCSQTRGVKVDPVANGTVANIGGVDKNAPLYFQYRFVKHSSGNYGIQLVNNNKYYLHIAANTYINSWETYGNVNSLWVPEKTNDGYWSFRNASYGTYIDVEGGRDEFNVPLDHYPGNGTAAQKFRLVPVDKSLADSDVEVSCSEHVAYSESGARPSITVKYLGVTLKEGEDYTISYKNNTSPGTATATITGVGGTPSNVDLRGYRGYYVGSRTVSFTVDPKDDEPPVIKSVKVVEQTSSKLVVDVVATDNVGVKTVSCQPSDLLGDKTQWNWPGGIAGERVDANTTRFTADFAELSASDSHGDHQCMVADAHRLYFWAEDAAGNSTRSSDVAMKGGLFSSIYDGLEHVDFEYQVGSRVSLSVGESATASELFGLSNWSGYSLISNDTLGLEHVEIASDNTGITALSEGTCWLFLIHNKTGAVRCAEVTIGNSAVDLSNATISSVKNQTYTGKALKPAPVVKAGSTTLKSGTDYTVTYKNNTNVGTATVTVTGKGSYTGTKSATFKIVAASIAEATVTVDDQTYTGSALTPAPTVTLGSVTLKSGTDYTVAYEDNTEVGTATVTVTGKGNYTGTAEGTFEIAEAPKTDIASATVAAIKNQTYTGKALKPAPSVKMGSVTLKSGTDYTLAYGSNTNVGTATITITGKGDYTGTKKVTFKVVAASIAGADVTCEDQTYTGAALTPAPSVTLGSTVLKSGTDYAVAYEDNTEVGTATVTVTGKGNYTGTAEGTFEISAGSIASATISSVKNQTYTGKALKPAPVVKAGSTTLKSGTDYTVAYKNNTNVGTATVTVTGKGNYSGTKSVTFKVVAASIAKATVTVADQTWTGKALKPTPTVTLGSVTLKSGTDYTVAYSNNTNAGTATVTVTGKGNYTGTAKGTFSITKSERENPFIDVTASTAHYEDILWLAEQGISTGWVTPAGKEFRPNANVKRGDMAAFLFRLAKQWGALGASDDWAPEPSTMAKFTDVGAGTSHSQAIWWMAENGISAGWAVGGGKAEFRPNADVKRGDLAAFLGRLAGKAGRIGVVDVDEGAFIDVTSSTSHSEEIWWMAANGISGGWAVDGGKEFRPNDSVKRGDMAAFLHRLDGIG